MKKIVSIILSVVMCAALTVSVMAADIAPNTVHNENNTWTTSGTVDAYKGKRISIIVYSGADDIVDDSEIQFAYQVTANASTGAFSFTEFVPYDMPYGVQYKVKLGIEGIDEAVDAGFVGPIDYVAVSASDEEKIEGATVEFFKDGNYLEDAHGTLEEGKLPPVQSSGTDTYNVVITKPGCLPYIITGIEVEVGTDEIEIDTSSIEFVFGDFVKTANPEDSVVDDDDLDAILSKLGQVSGGIGSSYSADMDYDGNGVINIDDITAACINIDEEAAIVAHSGL